MSDISLFCVFMQIVCFVFLYFVSNTLFKYFYLKKVSLYDNSLYEIIPFSKLKKIDSSIGDDGIVLIVLGIVLFMVFLPALLSSAFSFNEFFSIPFYILLLIFILIIIFRYICFFQNEDYLKLRRTFKNDFTLKKIRNLIDDLEKRKKVLSSYDEFDKYRSEEIIKAELEDLDKSMNLLKKMYSYSELNSSTSKVNEGFNMLKGTDIEPDELSNFEKELDILNAKRDLNKNIDSTIEKLKDKYK